MTLAATKASSRHRVRITNQTRLRVTRQPLDDLQETRDDEVARADVSTAGVDVEDAKVSNRPARRRPESGTSHESLPAERSPPRLTALAGPSLRDRPQLSPEVSD